MAADESKVMILKDFKAPVNPGAHYRLLCLTGNRKGAAFYLKGNRVVIGRGETADIQILDSKASREHAELTRLGSSFIVTDLGSHNGVIVNDIKITQKTLEEDDRIIVGSTVFKFSRIENNDPINIKVFNEEKSEGAPDKDAEKQRKILIYGIIGLLLVFLFMESDTSTENNKDDRININTDATNQDDFARALKKKRIEEDRELKDKLEIIFKRGLRELREKNYFRAMEEFRVALIHAPQNGTAMFYLEKTRSALNKEIDKNFEGAAKDLDALRVRSAIVSYCNIARLLQNYDTDERYKRADKRLREIEEKEGMKQNEIKCFQKQ